MSKPQKFITAFSILLLIVVLAIGVVGCTGTTDNGKQTLTLVTSTDDLVYTVGETVDLSKIVYNVLDADGKVVETKYVTAAMLSDIDLAKFAYAGNYTVTVSDGDLRLYVRIQVVDPITVINYEVKFDCNEAKGANGTVSVGYFDEVANTNVFTAPQSYINGDKLIALPIPHLAGFNFLGWYLDANGTGTKLSVNENTPYTLTAQSTTFYAQWQDQRQFTVTFKNGLTDAVIATQVVEYGKTATLPTEPVKGVTYSYNNKQYTFSAWDNSYKNVTANVDVYANFSEVLCSVVFYAADKTTVYRTFEVSYNSTFDADNIPELYYTSAYPREAYTAAWIDTNTNDELTEDITNVTANRNVYIKYTIKTFNMSFYGITKEEYDAKLALGESVDALHSYTLDYGKTLTTVPSAPLYADDTATPNVNESLKYDAVWRAYSDANVQIVPVWTAGLTSDASYFVLYTVKKFNVTFSGYGQNIVRTVSYGDTVSSIDVTSSYNPLIYTSNWYTSSTYKTPENIFNFNTPIVKNETLYFGTTHNDITVYYCMPTVYAPSGSYDFDDELLLTYGATDITLTGTSYKIAFDSVKNDTLARKNAYVLTSQVISYGDSVASTPNIDYKKYRQAEDTASKDIWYDYAGIWWDFNADYYQSLCDYVVANNISSVYLYAGLWTNDITVTFKTISYNGTTPVVTDIQDSTASAVYSYGDSFDPNQYAQAKFVGRAYWIVPEIDGEDTDMIFVGWYTTSNYTAISKITDGNTVDLTKNTIFYAKWRNAQEGSDGLVYELINGGTEYAVVDFVIPADVDVSIDIPLTYYNAATETDIPVTTIKAEIFNRVSGEIIKEIGIRSNIKSIEFGAFTTLSNLERFIMRSQSSAYYSVVNGVLYTADGKTLVKLPTNYSIYTTVGALKTFTIPAAVEVIANEAFAYTNTLYNKGDNVLQSVAFASGSALKTIGENAFIGCEELKSVQVPVTLQTIGAYAFNECSKLVTFEFSDSAYSIGSCGKDAFASTRWFNGKSGQIIFANVLVGYKGSDTAITIDNVVSVVADGALSPDGEAYANLTSITFAADSEIASIGNNAFNACPKLDKIEILANRVVSIQADSFSGIAGNAILYVAAARYSDYCERYMPEGVAVLDIDAIIAC